MTAAAQGRPTIRVAGPDDAAALLRLKQRLDLQTAFMLLEPGERQTSATSTPTATCTWSTGSRRVIEAIPKSASGKILRRVLRDAAAGRSA